MCVWMVLEWFLYGCEVVFGMFCDCFCLLSRSPVAGKVEEHKPLMARERTTGRAVWAVVGVFLVGWLDCLGLV